MADIMNVYPLLCSSPKSRPAISSCLCEELLSMVSLRICLQCIYSFAAERSLTCEIQRIL